jgi:hypothetical protein
MNEQQLAAVKQALEAFNVLSMNDYSGYECSKHETDKIDEAVTALQSIISQEALGKMADNARELGLSYDDVPAVQEGRDWSLLEATQESLREHMAEIKRLQKEIIEQCRIIAMSAEREDALRAEIKRLKAAQPAPVQDLPFGVGGGLVAIKTLLGRDPCVHANMAIEMIDAILKEHPAAHPGVKEG